MGLYAGPVREHFNKEVMKVAFEIPKQPYSGRIGVSTLGAGGASLKLGGQDSYSFHLFEGQMPNPPRIAMEVWDYDPSGEWPAAAVEPFKDVISSSEKWAKKCVEDFGADLIVLQLKSTDPNGMNRSADEAAKVARKVLEAIDVPLVVWGTANNHKDEEVLKKISEACEGLNVGLAPVEEGNHKGVGASSLGYGHCIIASSPIDVNLAKQLNVLLGNLGVGQNKLIIDPTTGGLGYGLEYSYSVMERIRMAALTQEDDKLQSPIINNIGNEIWKCKEAGQSTRESPTMGDAEKRAVAMETVAAVAYLMAGSDVVILRHPESVRVVRSFVELMVNGGSAAEIQPVAKRLEATEVDLAALSPEPDLNFISLKEAPKKDIDKKPEKKPEIPEKPTPEPAKAAPAETGPVHPLKAELKEDKSDALKAQEEKKAAEAAAARKKAEQEAREAEEARARAEAEKKAEARAEAERQAKAKAREQEREELMALRAKRAREREKLASAHEAQPGAGHPKTASEVQKDLVDSLIENLARIHRRK